MSRHSRFSLHGLPPDIIDLLLATRPQHVQLTQADVRRDTTWSALLPIVKQYRRTTPSMHM